MGAYELIRNNEGSGAGNPPDSPAKNLRAAEEGKFLDCNDDPARDQQRRDQGKPFINPPSAVLLVGDRRRRAQRLISLDVFRGLTVAVLSLDGKRIARLVVVLFLPALEIGSVPEVDGKLMILVDDAGGLFPSINHSPWNGVTLADFVMPFFLFIVGVSLGLAYKEVPNRASATRKAILRATKLFLLGIFLQGGYFHGVSNLTFGVDILSIRVMGVLQRIAIAYLVAAICEIWIKTGDDVDSGYSLLQRYRYQLLVCFVLASIYIALLYGLYVPDWEYRMPTEGPTSKLLSVKCGVRGDTNPACNAVGMIDRKILGIQHLYRRPVYERTTQCSINSPDSGPLPSDAPLWCRAPFDPEGLLSSVMAIVSCLIGLQFGHVIIHFKSYKDRVFLWMLPSFSLLALAFALDFFGMHMNKALYTISFTCVTAGAAGVLFTGIYVLVDVYGFRRPTFAMEWMGKHALMIYIFVACNVLPVLIQGFYWREPQNNILKLVGVAT